MAGEPFPLNAVLSSSIPSGLSLDAPLLRRIGSPSNVVNQQQGNKFMDSALQMGGGRLSLLRGLSATFGQGTEEIATRKMLERRQQIEDAVFESGTVNDEMTRLDGTQKGQGFFGELRRPDGRVSTELSIGIQIDGEEVLVPSLVPTLTKDEINFLLTHEGIPPQSIIKKAADFARQRKSLGLPFFAQPNEGIR